MCDVQQMKTCWTWPLIERNAKCLMCFICCDVRSARHQLTLPAHRYRYRTGASCCVLVYLTTYTGTHCAYAQNDDQAELSKMVVQKRRFSQPYLLGISLISCQVLRETLHRGHCIQQQSYHFIYIKELLCCKIMICEWFC